MAAKYKNSAAVELTISPPYWILSSLSLPNRSILMQFPHNLKLPDFSVDRKRACVGNAISRSDSKTVSRYAHCPERRIEGWYLSDIFEKGCEMEGLETLDWRGSSGSLQDELKPGAAADLARYKPDLYIALHLNSDPRSPWLRRLNTAPHATSGMNRQASLQTMQIAIRGFLERSRTSVAPSTFEACEFLRWFWLTISTVFTDEWQRPRNNFITKGIGVYALTEIAGDISESPTATHRFAYAQLRDSLVMLEGEVDWSHQGDFEQLKGAAGLRTAISVLRNIRAGACMTNSAGKGTYQHGR